MRLLSIHHRSIIDPYPLHNDYNHLHIYTLYVICTRSYHTVCSVNVYSTLMEYVVLFGGKTCTVVWVACCVQCVLRCSVEYVSLFSLCY